MSDTPHINVAGYLVCCQCPKCRCSLKRDTITVSEQTDRLSIKAECIKCGTVEPDNL